MTCKYGGWSRSHPRSYGYSIYPQVIDWQDIQCKLGVKMVRKEICGSDRIHRWDMHTCPKCGGKMQPTGEEEFWT
jgi:hypothetical protein